MTSQGLIFKIYQELIHSTSKKTNNPIKKKKTGRRTEKILSKEDIQMANRHINRCSILLIMREIQIKTTM